MAITRTDGFVDLRVSPTVSGRSDEDSVWPSFTDIMTVVVLIFLVSLVVILMRNTELVSQLRESVTQTETMTTQRGEMEMRIAGLGDEVVRLRSVLDQSEAERAAAEQTIELREDEISSLLKDVGALQRMRDVLADEKASLGEQLDKVRDEKKQLAEEKVALSDELAGVTSEREQLSEEKVALLMTQGQLETQVAALEQDRGELQATRASLQAEVAELVIARDRLAEEKVALSDELAGVTSEREQLALDLTDLKNALASVQAEQNRLIMAYEAQRQGQAAVTNARDALLRERDALADQVSSLEVTRGSLRAEVSALRDEMAGLVRSTVSTERALEESQLVGEELTARLAETALEYKLTKEELAYLRAEYADEVAAFAKERELLVSAHKEELDILRERHSDLESEYNRLVRPARSTVGRFVVKVRFWKEGDLRRYSLRPPSGIETSVSESELHQQLTALKARHGDKLFIKVIPDDNSLTHGEAWSFASKIHNRYDYYYQN